MCVVGCVQYAFVNQPIDPNRSHGGSANQRHRNVPITAPLVPSPRSLGRFLGSKASKLRVPALGVGSPPIGHRSLRRVGDALPSANNSHPKASVTALFRPKKKMASETDPGRYTNRAIGTRMSGA
jgi:hypothetical protein